MLASNIDQLNLADYSLMVARKVMENYAFR